MQGRGEAEAVHSNTFSRLSNKCGDTAKPRPLLATFSEKESRDVKNHKEKASNRKKITTQQTKTGH